MRFCKLILALAASAFAQTELTTDNSLDLELEGYAYLRYTTYGEEGSIPDESFEVRRAGMKADFALPSDLSGQLQLETRTDRVFLKDCFVEWEPLTPATITLGLFKVPFCANTLSGSWDLYSPEHTEGDGELSDLRFAGRDLGAMLSAEPTGFLHLSLCVSNGGPPELDPEDRELQHTARVVAELPGSVTLGLAGSRLRVGQEDPESVEGYVRSDPQAAWGADASWSRALGPRIEVGLACEYLEADNWLRAEVLEGAPAPLLRDLWGRGRITWYPGIAGRVERIDLSVRWERIDGSSQGDERKVLCPSLTVWPADTWRLRLAGMNNSSESGMDDNYTDFLLEMGAVF